MEEKDFKTINGTHVPIKKNGDITGKIAKKIKATQSEKTQLTDTTPKVNEFQKALEACQGDHYKAAQKFYKEHLQGKYIARQIDKTETKIYFTGNNFKKLKMNMKSDALKAQILPYIPDVIAHGNLQKVPLYKERDDGSLYFLSFSKAVQLKDSKRKVIADIKVTNYEMSHTVYNINYEGSENYIKREKTKKAQDGKTPCLWLRGSKDPPHKTKGFNGIIVKDSKNSSFEIIELTVKEVEMDNVALDSARSKDENGFLHVTMSHITKATINPYRGCEIPNWQELGLEPEKIYYALRDPDELKKSLETWKGLPLHLEHHTDQASDPQKDSRVGTVGTDVKWNAPYIDAPLTIWDEDVIKKIEDGTYKELSCAYRYEPDFSHSGYYDGEPYDFVMRNIRGNHVALVEEGRAGHDVVVADSKFNFSKWRQKMAFNLKKPFFKGASDDSSAVENNEVQIGEQVEELGQKLQNLHDDDHHDVGLDNDVIDELKTKYNLDDEAINDIVEKVTQKQQTQDEDTVEKEEETSTVKDEDVKNAFKKGLEYSEQKSVSTDDSNVISDDEKEELIKTAEDRALRKLSSLYRAKINAASKVASLVGRIDPMAFDSANGIYAFALRKQGIPLAKNPSAYESMVDALIYAKHGKMQSFAMDRKPTTHFNFEKHISNIKIEE